MADFFTNLWNKMTNQDSISTPSQTTNNINNIITTNILNSFQNTENNIEIQQTINAKCDSTAAKTLTDFYYFCVDLKLKTDPTNTTDIRKICNDSFNICSSSNINLDSTLNFTSTTALDEKSKQDILTNIKNSITQLSKDAANEQDIQNITNVVSQNIEKIYADVQNNSGNKQTIDLENYSITFVSLTQASTIINNTILNNKSIQDSISNISTTIIQLNLNDPSSLSLLYKIIGGVISIMFIIYILSLLITSKNVSQFFKKIIMLCSFIIIFVVIAYVIYKNPFHFLTYKNTKDEIIFNKFLYTCLLFVLYCVFSIIYTILSIIIF